MSTCTKFYWLTIMSSVRAGLRNALEVLPNFEIVGEVGNGRELMEATYRASSQTC